MKALLAADSIRDSFFSMDNGCNCERVNSTMRIVDQEATLKHWLRALNKKVAEQCPAP